ncbi:hypothetical protein QJQ45_025657, partial [Haematococcus lacustris]
APQNRTQASPTLALQGQPGTLALQAVPTKQQPARLLHLFQAPQNQTQRPQTPSGTQLIQPQPLPSPRQSSTTSQSQSGKESKRANMAHSSTGPSVAAPAMIEDPLVSAAYGISCWQSAAEAKVPEDAHEYYIRHRDDDGAYIAEAVSRWHSRTPERRGTCVLWPSPLNFMSFVSDESYLSSCLTFIRAGMFLAMRQACKRAKEYGVLHNPYALYHLIRAFVLPLELYGSQVWGTAFLGHGVQLSNPVQTSMLSFLRFAARVRSSVSGLMVLHELGQLPLQLYWLRAACKYWNTAKLSHSDLLMRVIKADVELGRRCQASWSAQFQLAARELMGGEFTLSPDMVLGTKAMEVKWLEMWGRRWVGFEGDPRLPETVHRERCSYAAWFKHGDGIGINHMAPHLLNRQLSTEVRTSLTRFRSGNNGLGVEKARFEGVTFIDRTCTRCTERVVDDAIHFIFECTATRSIREQPEYAMTFQNNNENLHDFMLSPCAPLFVHLALKCVTESPEPLEGEGGQAA